MTGQRHTSDVSFVIASMLTIGLMASCGGDRLVSARVAIRTPVPDVTAARMCVERGLPWYSIEAGAVICYRDDGPARWSAKDTIVTANRHWEARP